VGKNKKKKKKKGNGPNLLMLGSKLMFGGKKK
jgi:hypothetical protein